MLDSNKKVHLKDIAKEANVSIAMVSYVLNGKLTDRINEQTAQKIKEIAKRLNYRPNRIAKSLKTNRTHTVGLILPDLTNPFFSKIAGIMEHELKVSGYTVFIASVHEDNDKFIDMVETFSDRNVDGLILFPLEDSLSDVAHIHDNEIPYVLVDRYYKENAFNYVINDNHFGSYQLVNYLVDRGKRSLGLITTKYEMDHVRDRNRGFIDACNDLEVKQYHVKEIGLDDIKSNVYKAMDDLMNTDLDLDGVVFGSDVLALYGMGYAIQRQLPIPDKIELVAFDEAEYYNIFPSKIKYYRQPVEEIGKRAVKLLLSVIEQPDSQSKQEVLRGELLDT